MTEEWGMHSWFYALGWCFIREFFDLMEELPDQFKAEK